MISRAPSGLAKARSTATERVLSLAISRSIISAAMVRSAAIASWI
jgi:hypothetical protein